VLARCRHRSSSTAYKSPWEGIFPTLSTGIYVTAPACGTDECVCTHVGTALAATTVTAAAGGAAMVFTTLALTVAAVSRHRRRRK
jgi:hypothetical protein